MAMVKVIRDMLREFPDLYKWAVVCSFYPQTLYAVKWSIPQFSTILTHRCVLYSLFHIVFHHRPGFYPLESHYHHEIEGIFLRERLLTTFTDSEVYSFSH